MLANPTLETAKAYINSLAALREAGKGYIAAEKTAQTAQTAALEAARQVEIAKQAAVDALMEEAKDQAWQEVGGSQGNSAPQPGFFSTVGRKSFDLVNQLMLGIPANGRADSAASASVSEISQPIETKSEKEVSNKVAGDAIGEATSTLNQADGANESSMPAGNEQEQLTAFSEADIIEKKEADFKRDFLAGKIRTIISPQKQNFHVKGTKNFDRYVAEMAQTGDRPSYLREDLDIRDLNELIIPKLQGDVQYTARGYREFVWSDDVIGYYYSKRQGKYIATRCAQVIYSIKNGNIHIVPVKEKKEGN